MFRNALRGAVVVALWTGAASASIESRSISLTNDTGANWACVLFYITGPVFSAGAPFEAIRFVDDLALHSASQNPVDVSILDAPVNDVVLFDYSAHEALRSGGTYEFVLTVDNPFDEPFSIGWRTIPAQPIPSPGPAAVLAALLPGLSRRRRAG